MAKKNNPDRGLEQVGTQWRARFTFQGRRIRSPLFKTKTQAKAFLEKGKVANRLKGAFPEFEAAYAKGLPFSQVVQRYLRDNKHKKDWKREVILGNFWIEYFGEQPLHSITAQEIQAAQQTLVKKVSPARVNRYTDWLRHLFNVQPSRYGHRFNPVLDLARFSEAEGERPFVYTQDEMSRIYEALGPWGPAWELALLTGLRRGEQFGLLKGHINFAEGYIAIPRTKSNRVKIVVLSPRSASILQAQCDRHPFSPWVYPAERNPQKHIHPDYFYNTIFRPACTSAKVDSQKKWHTARHTWASNMLRLTKDPYLVKDAGNWASFGAMTRYLHTYREDIVESMERIGETVPRGKA